MPSNQPDLAGMMQAMMQVGSPRGGGGSVRPATGQNSMGQDERGI